uniref:Uncharacterized protein n=1 Tax=Setaria italica TaxID=4555 RepID=K3ZPS7_SETIT
MVHSCCRCGKFRDLFFQNYQSSHKIDHGNNGIKYA